MTTDNGAGVATYKPTNAKPGDSQSSCGNVRFGGGDADKEF